MRINCPACGKTNDLPTEVGCSCPRCGCDLGTLAQVVQSALSHQAAAVQALRDQRWSEARWHAESSWNLCHSPAAARLAFLSAIARQDTPSALRWYQQARASEPTG